MARMSRQGPWAPQTGLASPQGADLPGVICAHSSRERERVGVRVPGWVRVRVCSFERVLLRLGVCAAETCAAGRRVCEAFGLEVDVHAKLWDPPTPLPFFPHATHQVPTRMAREPASSCFGPDRRWVAVEAKRGEAKRGRPRRRSAPPGSRRRRW
jgi:hypothetical protein